MSIYRLASRKASGEFIKQGTAWQLGTNLLVTAFHVVGDEGKWYCEAFQNATYDLIGAGEASNEHLQPLGHDSKADIAVLKSPKPLPSSPLVPGEFEVVDDARWWVDGLPDRHGRKGLSPKWAGRGVRRQVAQIHRRLLGQPGVGPRLRRRGKGA
jgi:hypothetical protein